MATISRELPTPNSQEPAKSGSNLYERLINARRLGRFFDFSKYLPLQRKQEAEQSSGVKLWAGEAVKLIAIGTIGTGIPVGIIHYISTNNPDIVHGKVQVTPEPKGLIINGEHHKTYSIGSGSPLEQFAEDPPLIVPTGKTNPDGSPQTMIVTRNAVPTPEAAAAGAVINGKFHPRVNFDPGQSPLEQLTGAIEVQTGKYHLDGRPETIWVSEHPSPAASPSPISHP
jgi:hypothetical protein